MSEPTSHTLDLHSYSEERHSMDRASCASSIDGFSSHEALGDDVGGSQSPIDLICEQHIANDVSSSEDEQSPLGWPLARQQRSHLRLSPAPFGTPYAMPSSPTHVCESSNPSGPPRPPPLPEVDMIKERFARLLLGEDMSGCGKGVCTALAISNALTNLSASVFGELWRLEPLSPERKAMWIREMDWLLSVCDHIVEFVPSFQNIANGNSLEVMVSRQRSDLHINLPALRKLDAMLLEALDSFKESPAEFWYVEAQNSHKALETCTTLKREEDKWWLPVPKIPASGLSDKSRKALQNQRDCTSQILKAAMAINEQVLSEMIVPDVYWESLPKSARANLGEAIYNGLRQENFFPDALLSSLDLSTEHSALEVANRIQSAIHIWKKKEPSESNKNSRWLKVRDLVSECSDKRQLLIERADSLLLCLRQRFPGLPQTILDVTKIQYNKDVGQAILESYSRVLESLAFSILSRIDDVLYIADMTKRNQASTSVNQQQACSSSKVIPTVSFPNRLSVSINTPFITPLPSPASSSSAPDQSSKLQTAAAPCPTLLASLCSVEPASVVKSKERPWLAVEARKSVHSPPGRD